MLWEEITDIGGQLSGRDLLDQMEVVSNSAAEKSVGNRENLRVVQAWRANRGE